MPRCITLAIAMFHSRHMFRFPKHNATRLSPPEYRTLHLTSPEEYTSRTMVCFVSVSSVDQCSTQANNTSSAPTTGTSRSAPRRWTWWAHRRWRLTAWFWDLQVNEDMVIVIKVRTHLEQRPAVGADLDLSYESGDHRYQT